MRRWREGGGMVLTRMLYGGEKVFMLPLTRRLDYRLPKGREQVVGKLEEVVLNASGRDCGAIRRERRESADADTTATGGRGTIPVHRK